MTIDFDRELVDDIKGLVGPLSDEQQLAVLHLAYLETAVQAVGRRRNAPSKTVRAAVLEMVRAITEAQLEKMLP